MYNANIWWHFFQFFIFMCPVSFLTYKIFENNLKVEKAYYWAAVFFYVIFISSIIALTLTEISPYPQFSLVGINLIILSSIIIFRVVVRKNTFSLLFVFFLYLGIQYSSLLLAKATIDFHFIPQLIPYKSGDFLVLSLVYMVIMFPAAYFILIKLYKRIVDEEITTKWMNFFFCLPAGFFFAMMLLMSINIGENVAKETLLPLILLNMCAFISCFAALESILASHDAMVEHEKIYEANIQLALWEEQYKHLQGKVDAEAKIRHDWRHHIIMVLGFVEHKDLEGLDAYLAEYKVKYLLPEEVPVCDNMPLNMVFQYYKRKAADLNIPLHINTVHFQKCHVSDSELTIVFGNLLENAIEACNRIPEEDRFITLKIKNVENSLVAIICENSFDGILNQRNGKILSRKKEGGIGLSSIESIARKYHGILKIQAEQNNFKIYVSLSECIF